MFSCIKLNVVTSLLLSVLSSVACQLSYEIDPYYGDAICNNPYSTCQKISSCPPALEDIIHGGHPKICNFEGNEPIVCCDMRRSTGLQHGNVDVITTVSDSSENTLGRLKHRPQNPTGPPFGWLQHNAQNPSMPPFSRFPNNAQRPPLESQFGRFQNNVRNPMGPPFGRPQNPSGNPFQRLISNNQNEPQIPIPQLENNVQKPSGDTSERSDGATETTPFTEEPPTTQPNASGDTSERSDGATETTPFTEEPPTTQPNAGNTQSIDAGTTTTESSVWTTTPPPPIPGIENTKCVQKCQEYGKICWRGAPYVAGATEAKAKQFPHMALIGFGPENAKSWQCGGSVISKRYILSAAHCTFPGNGIGFAKWVRLGELDHSSTTDNTKHEDYTIIERINHPEYNPPQMYNDIALYKVDREIVFTDYIRPVCLHTTFDIAEREGKAAGWGRIEAAGPTSNHLLYANISFVSPEMCKGTLQNNLSRSQFPDGVRTDSIVCAGEADGSKDTCQGDSGGPLFFVQSYPWPGCLFRQVGITSTGLLCSQEDSPGLYTRVSSFIPWIESIVWEKDP